MLNDREALAQINAHNYRQIDSIPGRARKLAEEQCFYIYNVGPFNWDIPLGGLGRFTILKCDDGKRHSEPLVIPGIVYQTAVGDTNQHLRQVQFDGYQVAQDICGIGSGKHESESLLRMGVFISEHNPPKEAEIVAARGRLQDYYKALVQEADNFAAQGPMSAKEIQPNHLSAAKALNIEREWSKGVTAMEQCPGCGEVVKPGLILHGGKNGCGWIFDRKRYDEAVAMGNMAGALPEPTAVVTQSARPEPGKPIFQGKR